MMIKLSKTTNQSGRVWFEALGYGSPKNGTSRDPNFVPKFDVREMPSEEDVWIVVDRNGFRFNYYYHENTKDEITVDQNLPIIKKGNVVSFYSNGNFYKVKTIPEI